MNVCRFTGHDPKPISLVNLTVIEISPVNDIYNIESAALSLMLNFNVV